jgi:plasmid stabilization system protein ParE
LARVIVSPVAAETLAQLVITHSLPASTRERFKRSIAPLEEFPLLGRALEDASFAGLRFILGPWRWMVIVYEHDPEADEVRILTVEAARSSNAATNYRA